jgi:hypothetical protein
MCKMNVLMIKMCKSIFTYIKLFGIIYQDIQKRFIKIFLNETERQFLHPLF